MTILSLTLAAVLAQAPQAQMTAQQPEGGSTLAIQVALDRAGFSPGVIDGLPGANTRRALDAYRKARGADPAADGEVLTTYTIAEQDAGVPLAREIPADLTEKSKLPSLGYTSLLEAAAERYHATPALLKRLNPAAVFAPGEQIRVPNVEPFTVPSKDPDGAAGPRRPETGTSGKAAPGASAPGPAAPDVVVTVSRSAGALTVTNARNEIVFRAPVTTGSVNDPLPIGEWKVTGVAYNPPFNYNPDLFWDADPSHAKAKLAPGPNNPVGVVWIDLSKEHYGIHGTPEPAAVGKTASHGCVRLTNWDALRLAGMVRPGTRVVFAE
jgi:lipoprotein-anchoring transpeptidase ErfK/SrfK